MEPLVSIVMPTYNRAGLIAESIMRRILSKGGSSLTQASTLERWSTINCL